jgi:hypothetical protein
LESKGSLSLGMLDLTELSRKLESSYKLNLPREMRAIFPVFHVSQLKKCLHIPEERVTVRKIKLKSDLSYEKPAQVLDTQERVTRSRVIKLYKVVWSNYSERDTTWEREDYLKTIILNSITNGTLSKSRDEIFIRGEAVTP